MPIFEKECNSCFKEFEFFGKYEDSRTCECPHCFSKDISHNCSSPSTKFTGEGFYATEHGNQQHNRGNIIKGR